MGGKMRMKRRRFNLSIRPIINRNFEFTAAGRCNCLLRIADNDHALVPIGLMLPEAPRCRPNFNGGQGANMYNREHRHAHRTIYALPYLNNKNERRAPAAAADQPKTGPRTAPFTLLQYTYI